MKFLKFSYLMEGFRIDFKTFLGFAMPNKCSQTFRKSISSWFNNFGVIILGQNPQIFMIPLYSVPVLHDIYTIAVIIQLQKHFYNKLCQLMYIHPYTSVEDLEFQKEVSDFMKKLSSQKRGHN